MARPGIVLGFFRLLVVLYHYALILLQLRVAIAQDRFSDWIDRKYDEMRSEE